MAKKDSKKGSSAKKSDVISLDSFAEQLKGIDQKHLELEAHKMSLIHKAMNTGSPLDMVRAANSLSDITKKSQGAGNSDRQTYTFDPFTNSHNMGFKESPTNITDFFLRGMARAPIIRGVIDTRMNQISNFARPTMDMGKVGWTIRRKPDLFHEEKVVKYSSDDKAIIKKIADFISNCGVTDDTPFSQFKRVSFETWLRETTRDSLTLDNLSFECIENRRGDLAGFVSVDGATIRHVDEMAFYDENNKMKKEVLMYGMPPSTCQIYNQRIVSTFYPWQLCFGIRNKSTDITQNGYGVSEMEDLVKIVTWMLFGDAYNGKFFSQGAAPKGILKVSGNVNQDKLNEFRMYWQQMVTGVANAWRTPVLESDKIEWIDLQKSNQDMQFQNWQEYLIRVICAVFKIDAAELGFMFKGSGGKGGEVNTSHKQRTDYSKDKGLVPLLRFYEEIINRYFVSRLHKDFEFCWTGLDIDDEAASVDINVKKVGNWMTIDEVRARQNPPLPPLPNGAGKIILNAVYAQSLMGGNANTQSNDFIDNEDNGSGDNEDKNPFDLDAQDDVTKGAFKDINDWIAAGMPDTLEKIEK